VIDSTPAPLRGFTKLVSLSTLFLVFAGAMVTSTGSGLAVPDWPLSYGMLMPPMVGGIFYEHGHRMIASAVGFLTLVQACWLQFREPKRFVRKLGWLSLLAVCVQGLLGGVTVLFFLPKAISISHAALAEIFFCINLSIAFFTSKSYLKLRDVRAGSDFFPATRFVFAAIFSQILLGAWMRHLGAGLAIPDYPLSFGRVIPPLREIGVIANFSHRTWAYVVAAIVVVVVLRIFSRGVRPLFPLATALVSLFPIQVLLGAFTIWSEKHAITTSLHVVTGAALFGISFLLMLTAHTVRAPRGIRVESTIEREPVIA